NARDYHFVRQQTINRLRDADLPQGVQPVISPAGTISEIFRYELKGPPDMDLIELKTLQDWVVERRLRMVPGESDVLVLGGKTKEVSGRDRPQSHARLRRIDTADHQRDRDQQRHVPIGQHCNRASARHKRPSGIQSHRPAKLGHPNRPREGGALRYPHRASRGAEWRSAIAHLLHRSRRSSSRHLGQRRQRRRPMHAVFQRHEAETRGRGILHLAFVDARDFLSTDRGLRLGQPFVVENRTGAATNIAAEAVVRSPPDGYTLLFVTSANATNATVYEKLNFNFMRDIAPVAATKRSPPVLQVHPSFPANNLADFISYAKANPGKISLASFGTATVSHLAGELFKAMAGINLLHVPYRGTAPMLSDLLGGQVQASFDNLAGSIEFIKL